MVPLPWKVKTMLSDPLQTIATHITTYTLQTLGMPALREGHIIVINDFRIGVVEACSGLSMLVVFFALSTAVAIVINRPLGDRIFIFLSAAPIAVASNVIRIIVTALLYLWVGKEAGDRFFHDLAGWFMMPLALLFMWLELKLISLVLVEPEEEISPVQARSKGESGHGHGRSGAATAASAR
jgi:exosortase